MSLRKKFCEFPPWSFYITLQQNFHSFSKKAWFILKLKIHNTLQKKYGDTLTC